MSESIIFSILEMRSDITFTTLVIVGFVKYLSHQHIKELKTVLQYLTDLRKQEINFND